MARVVVLLGTGEERRFDAYCQAKGHKKSPLVARLIREHLDREGFAHQEGLFEQGEAGGPQPRRVAASRGSRRGEGTRA